MSDHDPTSSARKADHIRLALRAQLSENDDRFYYEPFLGTHPDTKRTVERIPFLGKSLKDPIWISSMTGGTEAAGTINRRLASTCRIFGLGMGLGSCRMILEDDTYLADFQLRAWAGDDVPLFANLGICQVEQLIQRGRVDLIQELIRKTETDGLIIHVNPLQEWLQPEGDAIRRSPLETITDLLERADMRLIVKEVGQGFGPASLRALSELPLAAIDFASFGGTNFSLLEAERSGVSHRPGHEILARTGHTAEEMIGFYTDIYSTSTVPLPAVIISGGIRNFLDGYYFMQKCPVPSVYGQASSFLKVAMESEESLHNYVQAQTEGLRIAGQMLRIKKKS